jgi:hypothetical protein
MSLLNGPHYWMYETSGALRPAVMAYLHDDALTPEHIGAIRAYLRQWVFSPVWGESEGVQALRVGVDSLTSREAIDDWLELALEEGIDPL